MISVISTNYQCGHALERHIESIYAGLAELDFEYIVVDNFSYDASWRILQRQKKVRKNFICWQEKCSMGLGRNLAVEKSHGDTIVIVDTDTIYEQWIGKYIPMCMEKYPNLAIQAIYCGVFPKKIWKEVGGRKDINTCEDFDMWMRIHELGKMRWYPVITGENIKDSSDSADYASKRYTSKAERIMRLWRSESDLWKMRKWERLDLVGIWKRNSVDFGLAPLQEKWFGTTPSSTHIQRVKKVIKGTAKIVIS